MSTSPPSIAHDPAPPMTQPCRCSGSSIRKPSCVVALDRRPVPAAMPGLVPMADGGERAGKSTLMKIIPHLYALTMVRCESRGRPLVLEGLTH